MLLKTTVLFLSVFPVVNLPVAVWADSSHSPGMIGTPVRDAYGLLLYIWATIAEPLSARYLAVI